MSIKCLILRISVRNLPPSRFGLGLGLELGLVLGLGGGQFSSGVIVLEPSYIQFRLFVHWSYCFSTNFTNDSSVFIIAEAYTKNFQTSKTELFVRIINAYKLLSIFCKKLNLGCFFSIRVFFHEHHEMRIHRKSAVGWGPFLFPSTTFHPLTNIWTFTCNFASVDNYLIF